MMMMMMAMRRGDPLMNCKGIIYTEKPEGFFWQL